MAQPLNDEQIQARIEALEQDERQLRADERQAAGCGVARSSGTAAVAQAAT
jgi:hypothetical protein